MENENNMTQGDYASAPEQSPKKIKFIVALAVSVLVVVLSVFYYFKWRDGGLWQKGGQKEITLEEKKVQEMTLSLDKQMFQLGDTDNKETAPKSLEESTKSLDQTMSQLIQPKTQQKPKTVEEMSRSLDSLFLNK